MAVTPDSITEIVSLGSFNIFGQAGEWIFNVLIAALLAGVVFILYQYFFAYTIKVRWTWVRGAEKKKSGLKTEYTTPGKVLNIPFIAQPVTLTENYEIQDIVPGKTINDKGKLINKKGVTYIKLLKGRSVFKYFPKHRYHDGLYCARIDKSTFMPMKRPCFGENQLILEPIDNDIKFWATMKLQELRMRLEDDEYKKKSLYVFFGAIIVICIFAGLVIWMSYTYSNNHLASQGIIADKLGTIADKIGLGGPG